MLERKKVQAANIIKKNPTQTRINHEKYTFCVIKSMEHLKNVKNGPILYLGLKLTIHVIKNQTYLVRQSLKIHDLSCAHQSVAARAALLALLALYGVGGHAALLEEPGLGGAAQLLVAHATVDLNIKSIVFQFIEYLFEYVGTHPPPPFSVQ
jgi:hypothetical protein